MRFYTFEIVIEKEAEDDGYAACSPTLPGGFSNGKTIEGAKRNIREAIRFSSTSRRCSPTENQSRRTSGLDPTSEQLQLTTEASAGIEAEVAGVTVLPAALIRRALSGGL